MSYDITAELTLTSRSALPSIVFTECIVTLLVNFIELYKTAYFLIIDVVFNTSDTLFNITNIEY